MEEEVQEAEDAGARKRKRRSGVAGEEAGSGARGGGGDVGARHDDKEELMLADEDDGGGGGDEEGRYEGIAEEAVAEVMRWLEAEIAGAPPAPPPAGPVAVAVDGGNEESCGASFSAAASTVMASVDARPGAPPPPRVPCPWPPQPWLLPAAESDPEMDVAAARPTRRGSRSC